MATQKKKAEVAWLMTILLERGKSYAPAELDRLIRDSIRSDLLVDPKFAPDHIRLAMLQHQFLERDATGMAYRVHPEVMLPNENEQLFRKLHEDSLKINPQDMLRCPFCGESHRASGVVNHFARRHRLAGQWELLMERYAR